jgi:uncharacterized OB-fold protein
MVGAVVADASSEWFFTGTRRREFLLPRCERCGHLSEPLAQQCASCAGTDLSGVAASGHASLVSWAVVHSKPDAAGSTDTTVICIVELAEGPWWWSQLVGVAPDQLAVGLPLLVHYESAGEGYEWVPVFRAQ